MRFVAGSEAQARQGGLLIGTLASTDPRLGGRTTLATHVVDGTTTIAWTRIDLRPGASAGIRRHELGHAFSLAHHESSELMRAVPVAGARYGTSERRAMRDLARRSGCP
ncbi:MAG: hypothetical protein R2702_04705 [Acidimicrobiales bacterium]